MELLLVDMVDIHQIDYLLRVHRILDQAVEAVRLSLIQAQAAQAS